MVYGLFAHNHMKSYFVCFYYIYKLLGIWVSFLSFFIKVFFIKNRLLIIFCYLCVCEGYACVWWHRLKWVYFRRPRSVYLNRCESITPRQRLNFENKSSFSSMNANVNFRNTTGEVSNLLDSKECFLGVRVVHWHVISSVFYCY